MNSSSFTSPLSEVAVGPTPGHLLALSAHLLPMLERATLATDTGCYEQALEAWTEVIRLQPYSAFAYLNRGGILAALCCWSEAIGAFQQAARLQPRLKEAHYGLGMAYGHLGFFTQAIELLRQAAAVPAEVAQQTYHEERHRLHEMARAASHTPAYAAASYTFSVESPAPPIAPTADARVSHGSEHEAHRRPREEAQKAPRSTPKAHSLSETLAYLQRARRRRIETPEIVVLCNQVGDHLAERGQYGEAETLYKQALHIQRRTLPEGHPDMALGLNNLALLYDRRGLYRKAETLYQHALDIAINAMGLQDTLSQTVLQNYTFLLLEQGKREQAALLLAPLGYRLPNE